MSQYAGKDYLLHPAPALPDPTNPPLRPDYTGSGANENVSLSQLLHSTSQLLMLTPDFLFSLANQVAFGGWLLLLVAPRWRGTRAVVLNGALPLLLAATYVILITYQTIAHPAPGAGFGSLGQVAALFRQPWALVAGWVHYLCFDMAVGAWESRDAQRRGVPHLVLLPCLAATFLLGPLGLLLYSAVRRRYPRPAAAAI